MSMITNGKGGDGTKTNTKENRRIYNFFSGYEKRGLKTPQMLRLQRPPIEDES